MANGGSGKERTPVSYYQASNHANNTIPFARSARSVTSYYIFPLGIEVTFVKFVTDFVTISGSCMKIFATHWGQGTTDKIVINAISSISRIIISLLLIKYENKCIEQINNKKENYF